MLETRGLEGCVCTNETVLVLLLATNMLLLLRVLLLASAVCYLPPLLVCGADASALQLSLSGRRLPSSAHSTSRRPL
eukprot:COSAG05_NODE_14522_length_394_cov_1.301695_1_plen_76_part_10